MARPVHCDRAGRTCEVLVKAAWAPTCRTDLPRQSSKGMVGTEPSQPTALLVGMSSNDDIPVVGLGEHLSAPHLTELNYLVLQFSDVFSETPGQTNVISHDI